VSRSQKLKLSSSGSGLSRGHVRSAFRQVRKALGPDRLSSIVLHIMNMALGEFTSVSTQAERLTRDEEEISITAQLQDPRINERQADLRAMDVALGLGHARSDTVNGVGPIISGDYSVSRTDHQRGLLGDPSGHVCPFG
jgi:hypothetical protein